MATLGQRMRERRKQLGLSQQALARLLGLPQSKISELERDVRSDMLLSTARHVARALHMSLDELAGDEGTGAPRALTVVPATDAAPVRPPAAQSADRGDA